MAWSTPGYKTSWSRRTLATEGLGSVWLIWPATTQSVLGARLHVDFDDDLKSFYYDACGFKPTNAGLIDLS
jgi:hypothetical protein